MQMHCLQQRANAKPEPTGLEVEAGASGSSSLIARLERENRSFGIVGFIRPRSVQAFSSYEALNALRWGQPLLLDLWHLVESARAAASAASSARSRASSPGAAAATPERVLQLNLAHAFGKVRLMMDHLLSDNYLCQPAPFAVTLTSAPVLAADPSAQVASKWLFGQVDVAHGIATLRDSRQMPHTYRFTLLIGSDCIGEYCTESTVQKQYKYCSVAVAYNVH